MNEISLSFRLKRSVMEKSWGYEISPLPMVGRDDTYLHSRNAMKVYAQIILSRDGYIAWVGDDISWISEKTREQYTRTIYGMGNCIIGRRAYQRLQRVVLSESWSLPAAGRDLNDHKDSSVDSLPQNDKRKLFEHSNDPFVVVMSRYNRPSEPNRHFTHAKPKNILKLLDEKWYSSTVICGGVEAIKLFIDAGLVDRLIVYREDVDVWEGGTFPMELLEAWECVQEWEIRKIYQKVR